MNTEGGVKSSAIDNNVAKQKKKSTKKKSTKKKSDKKTSSSKTGTRESESSGAAAKFEQEFYTYSRTHLLIQLKQTRAAHLASADLSVTLLLTKVMGLNSKRLNSIYEQPPKDNPIYEHLFNLTMKLRSGAEHMEELLANNGLIHIMDVIATCFPAKYSHLKPGQINATQIHRDTMDICCGVSVFHEIVFYRCGCVALAKQAPILDLLFETTKISMLMSAHVLECGNFHDVGMFEQAILDMIGRLLCGLDQDPDLRGMVASRLRAEMKEFEDNLSFVSSFLSGKGPAAMNHHCIDIQGTISRLKTLLSELDKGPTTWHSTFRLDRSFVPKPEDGFDDYFGGATKCHACQVQLDDLQCCSQCRSVFYCSRNCQKKEWKTHKKNCVKNHGHVPSGDMTGRTAYLIEQLEKKLFHMK